MFFFLLICNHHKLSRFLHAVFDGSSVIFTLNMIPNQVYKLKTLFLGFGNKGYNTQKKLSFLQS